MSAKNPYLFPIILIFSCATLVHADILHLKNGRSLECVVERETPQDVEVNTGEGTITFGRVEIGRIDRSTAAQTAALWQRWGEEKMAREKRKPREDLIFKERQKERERIFAEETTLRKAKQDRIPNEIKVAADNHQMIVNALLNGTVRANLVLDSGAGAVVLSKRMAEKLGIDLEKLKKGQTQVADGRMVETAYTVLKSVKLQDIGIIGEESEAASGVETKDVETVILTHEVDELENGSGQRPLPDGLLGMSFLKNFKFNADYQNQKLTFERLEKKTPAA